MLSLIHRLQIALFVGSGGGQGQAVLPFFLNFFLSDSILRLFYFYPTLTCWCNSLNKKAQKELYERRQQQIGDEDVFLKNFSFISWVQQPFNGWGNFSWIQLKWLNPPDKVFKNTLIVSWYMCVLIWYFKALTMC